MRFLYLLLTLLTINSCSKNTEQRVPEPDTLLIYQELYNQEVGLNDPPLIIDTDQNGKSDLIFSVAITYNPTTGITEKSATVINLAGTYLPIQTGDPTPLLSYGDKIHQQYFTPPQYHWNNAWRTFMASKQLSPITSNDWKGLWVGASHKYIPFLIEWVLGAPNYGWIEISFDTTQEKIILHKCAVSHTNEYNKVVKAGH
jgi:hypothetical protein